MSYVLELELPGLPKTTNALGRAHWTVKAKEARVWINAVMAAVRSNSPPPPRHESKTNIGPLPLSRAKLTLLRCSASEPDFDGLVSSFKHVIDGLIRAGVIASDKPSVIGQPEYRWEKAKPRQGMIKVRVEQVCELKRQDK